ncbi:MAG: hypothetical protein LBQ76_05600, partial [Candidatus Fibromonas sp.]|nr:hypothetical protein [Candidatus Fibromonas sp.]
MQAGTGVGTAVVETRHALSLRQRQQKQPILHTPKNQHSINQKLVHKRSFVKLLPRGFLYGRRERMHFMPVSISKISIPSAHG